MSLNFVVSRQATSNRSLQHGQSFIPTVYDAAGCHTLRLMQWQCFDVNWPYLYRLSTYLCISWQNYLSNTTLQEVYYTARQQQHPLTSVEGYPMVSRGGNSLFHKQPIISSHTTWQQTSYWAALYDSPSSIIAMIPRTLTCTTSPLAWTLSPISHTSSGSLSPLAFVCSSTWFGSSHVYGNGKRDRIVPVRAHSSLQSRHQCSYSSSHRPINHRLKGMSDSLGHSSHSLW